MNMVVYKLYSEYNRHECEGVWLIIKYEVYGHDMIMFKLLLELIFELKYDFVT